MVMLAALAVTPTASGASASASANADCSDNVPANPASTWWASAGASATGSFGALDVGATAKATAQVSAGALADADEDVNSWVVSPLGSSASAYAAIGGNVPVGTNVYAESNAQVVAVFGATDADTDAAVCAGSTAPASGGLNGVGVAVPTVRIHCQDPGLSHELVSGDGRLYYSDSGIGGSPESGNGRHAFFAGEYTMANEDGILSTVNGVLGWYGRSVDLSNVEQTWTVEQQLPSDAVQVRMMQFNLADNHCTSVTIRDFATDTIA